MEVIRVSSKQGPGTYVNEAKSRFAKVNSVELQALEGGISTAVKAAESLVHFGYANIARFETSLLEDEGHSSRFKGIAKVTIRLDKSPNFDAAASAFEKSRAAKSE